MNLPDKEQYINLITLLKETLLFYSKGDNYKENVGINTVLLSMIEIDNGAQARAILAQVDDFLKQHEEMEQDYDELLKSYSLSNNDNKETNPMEKFMEEIEKIKKNGNKI